VSSRSDRVVADPAGGNGNYVTGVVPPGVAASPDGARTYAPVAEGVAVVDTATGDVLSVLPVPNPTGAIVATADGRVLMGTETGVSVVDVSCV